MKYRLGDRVYLADNGISNTFVVHSIVKSVKAYFLITDSGWGPYIIDERHILGKVLIPSFSPSKSIKPFLLKDVL